MNIIKGQTFGIGDATYKVTVVDDITGRVNITRFEVSEAFKAYQVLFTAGMYHGKVLEKLNDTVKALSDNYPDPVDWTREYRENFWVDMDFFENNHILTLGSSK